MQEGQISQANLSEIRRTFKHLDKNEDNKLSAVEFVRGGKIIGIQMTKEEAQDMISGVDTNGSGYIEYEEYEKLMNIQLNKMDKQRAMHLKNFKKYDKDGSGFINFEELKLVLSQPGYDMTEKTIVEHFNKADKNSDGKISFNEFVKYFCEM